MAPERLRRESTIWLALCWHLVCESYDFGNPDCQLQNKELSQLETISHRFVCGKVKETYETKQSGSQTQTYSDSAAFVSCRTLAAVH